MDASAYAFTHGVRRTRSTLRDWRHRPGPVLRAWVLRSAGVACALLLATWLVSTVAAVDGTSLLVPSPPLATGTLDDVGRILARNLLVLALHSMACVAGFIAGSSLPLQAERMTGMNRWVHERGRPIALGFVVCATAFSLSMQALSLGSSVALVSSSVHHPAALVLLTLMPHALPELTALFLPLAAWLLASRRGEWEQLLAATLVTTTIALPVLAVAAVAEVYVTPHLLRPVLGV